MRKLQLDEPGYAFPMQFWPQVWHHGLRVTEIPVRLIYNDPTRHFGGKLDDACVRAAALPRRAARRAVPAEPQGQVEGAGGGAVGRGALGCGEEPVPAPEKKAGAAATTCCCGE